MKHKSNEHIRLMRNRISFMQAKTLASNHDVAKGPSEGVDQCVCVLIIGS